MSFHFALNAVISSGDQNVALTLVFLYGLRAAITTTSSGVIKDVSPWFLLNSHSSDFGTVRHFYHFQGPSTKLVLGLEREPKTNLAGCNVRKCEIMSCSPCFTLKYQ